MATYNKFEDFVEQLGLGQFNLTGDQLNIALVRSTDAPAASDSVIEDMTQPTGTGYTAGGEDTQQTWAEASGTATLTGTKVVWTASDADWQSFRYVVLYKVDAASPAVNRVIGYWDYGADLTLNNGETFTTKFNDGDPTGTIFTLA